MRGRGGAGRPAGCPDSAQGPRSGQAGLGGPPPQSRPWRVPPPLGDPPNPSGLFPLSASVAGSEGRGAAPISALGSFYQLEPPLLPPSARLASRAKNFRNPGQRNASVCGQGLKARGCLYLIGSGLHGKLSPGATVPASGDTGQWLEGTSLNRTACALRRAAGGGDGARIEEPCCGSPAPRWGGRKQIQTATSVLTLLPRSPPAPGSCKCLNK